VKVPFTWKVTGWFMVGWSLELPIGEVRPLHYFGEDLVAKGCMALRKWATQFYEVPA
jgi:hypothetical protein